MQKIAAALLITIFLAFHANYVLAKTEQCTVETVEGDKVTMTCTETKLKPGEQVKVKRNKQKECDD